jgi:hypothetical protein
MPLIQHDTLNKFISLWNYLWLAKTSQQPISQTYNLAEGVTPIVTITALTLWAAL